MMLSTLARASLDGALVVALVWAVCLALPRLSAAARTALWWCAAAKFVLALVWIAPVPLPILPFGQHTAATREAIAATANVTAPPAAIEIAGRAAAGGSSATQTDADETSRWSLALFVLWALWVGGLVAGTSIAVGRWLKVRAIVAQSSAAPASVQQLAASLAGRLGLGKVPQVLESFAIDTPLVTGLLAPVVLLPAGRFARLDERQQQMALCHELAHLARRDLALGCIPAVAERLFFFHPLVHVAVREYALWREAACDAAVLAALDAAPQEYGRLLLDLGVSRRHGRLAAAGASWSLTSLKRRIAMLRHTSASSAASRTVAAGAFGIALAAMIPVHLTARPPAAAVPETQTSQPAPADHALAAPGLAEERAQTEKERNKEPDINYVLFLDDHHTNMSGSRRDIERARRFKEPNAPLLWFRHEGQEYIVRDAKWLQQVEGVWIPVNELGDQMGAVGERQGAIGEKQGEVGELQGEIGEKQGNLGERQGRLAEREARRTIGAAERQAIEQEAREIEAQMKQLDREMQALDVKMRKFEAPMRQLEDEMKVLEGKMEQASRVAADEMRSFFARAIAAGAATPVR